jgi:hypothetical protein
LKDTTAGPTVAAAPTTALAEGVGCELGATAGSLRTGAGAAELVAGELCGERSHVACPAAPNRKREYAIERFMLVVSLV